MAKIKFGKAFSDSVVKFKLKPRHHNSRFTGWGVRLTSLYIYLVVAFFGLILRLFHLTVVQGRENRELSEGNRIQTRILHAPRGIFYDRRGVPLVKNTPALRVGSSCQINQACSLKLVLPDEWQETDIFVERDYLREYIYPEATAHVLGYLTEIAAEELKNPYYTYQDYLLGDRVGRTGLEQVLEKKLRGIDGKELVEVSADGRKVRTLGEVEVLPGTDVHLTLDIDLQKVAAQAFAGKKGAVVVSKPRTGEILALVSQPAFDPNRIHHGLSREDYRALSNHPDQPLFNRAISGVYPPGSTFKIVAAIAGLESGKITPQTLVEDVGILRIGEFSFANWYFSQYGGTEGNIDIVKAIARSNDIYFYKLGEFTGVETVASWGQKFGLGKASGIELANEAEGIMPDPDWREQIKGEKWYLGDTYHLAIGQGDLATTPLQVNMFTDAIASGGVLCQPTLLKSSVIPSTSFRASRHQTSDKCEDLKIKKETIKLVSEGMMRACSRDQGWGYQGTGWPLFDFTVSKEIWDGEIGKQEMRRFPVACKTGTAEFGDPENKTHAWFTAFAPLPAEALVKAGASSPTSTITGEPEIVVTVLVEAGGEGSSVAAPIAKQILEEWFGR